MKGSMRMWMGWPVQRILFVFVGVVFVALFVQVTLMHGRQNFRHWAMWLPVIGTPLNGLLAFMLAWHDGTMLRTIFTYVTVGVGAAGLLGTVFHWEGVGERVDGYTLNNFLVGPPVMLPIVITAISVLALIALFLL